MTLRGVVGSVRRGVAVERLSIRLVDPMHLVGPLAQVARALVRED